MQFGQPGVPGKPHSLVRCGLLPCASAQPAVTWIAVQHACDKCGAAVEDGTPFCKQCGTPQIRVSGFEVPGGSSAESIDYSFQPDAPSLHWSQALPAAATAGLVAAISMLLPFGALGLGIFAGGYVSVRLYQRRVPAAMPTSGMGARLGAVSGVLGFVYFTIFTAIEVLVFHSGGELHDALIQAVQQSISRTSDPQAQQALQYLKSPPGLALVMTMGLVLMFVLFLVFASVGGVLGAARWRRSPRP